MFPGSPVDATWLPYVRHPTDYKNVKVLAKIDGTNWYDISKWVQEVRITNALELLNAPAIDGAEIILLNLHNEWSVTQYNDTFDPTSGKFNGTTTQAYLEKEWEIKIELSVSDGVNALTIPLFYGVKVGLEDQHRTARLVAKDIGYYATKKKLETDLLYVGMTPDAIISDLLTRCGYATTQLDLQVLTTPITFLARKDETYWSAVGRLVQGVGGKLSVTPDGKIIFRTRLENYTDPSPVVSIDETQFRKYELRTEREYNQVKITSNGYTVDTTTSYVVDVELTSDNSIAPGTEGTFQLDYISEYATDVATTAVISYETSAGSKYEDMPVSLGYNDGVIEVTKYDIYGDKLVLGIKNLLADNNVILTKVRVQGRQIRMTETNTVIRENVTDQPDKEYSVESFYDSSASALLEVLADIIYDDINRKIQWGLALNDFYPEVFAGNLVNLTIPSKGISGGTYLVLKVEHQLEPKRYQTSINVIEWSGLSFEVGTKTVTTNTRTRGFDVVTYELYQDVQDLQTKTQQYDGQPPSTPTNLNLATELDASGASVVIVGFTPSPESDVNMYEIAVSYDNINWSSFFVTEPPARIGVAGNMTVYVKVRALDSEGYTSDWSPVVSIVSAKDTVPPAQPVLRELSRYPSSAVIVLEPPAEVDFDHYKVIINSDVLNPVIETSTRIQIDVGVDQTATVDIYAVDKSGNESTPLTVTIPALTVPVPQNLTLSSTANADGTVTATASWDAVTDPRVSSYEFAYSYDNGVSWQTIETTSTSYSWEVPGSITLAGKVRSVTADGLRSDWSAVVSITTASDTTPPAAPSNFTAQPFAEKIKLTWSANTEPDFDHYELQVSTDNFATILEEYIVYDNYFIYTATGDGTTYYFRLRAVDKSGNTSAWVAVSTSIGMYDAMAQIYGDASIFINSDFMTVDGKPTLDGWKLYRGSAGSVVQVTDGVSGPYAVQNAPGAVCWYMSEARIAVDPNRQYLIEGYFRTVSGTVGTIYLAVILEDENGNNITGDGTWWYYAASNVRPPAGWTYYYGLFGADTAKPFPSNAKYMRVGFILNYNNGDSIQQVQGVRIREVIDSIMIKDAAITGAKIKTATITDAHIISLDASKITTGTLDANRIAAGSITADKLNIMQLSEISQNVGIVVSGRLRNSAGTTYLDLDAGQLVVSNGTTVVAKVGVGAIGGTTNGIYVNNGNILIAGGLTADNIAAGAITSEKISTGAVTTDKLAAGAVTAEKIAAGSITVGALSGDTYSLATGGTIFSESFEYDTLADFWANWQLFYATPTAVIVTADGVTGGKFLRVYGADNVWLVYRKSIPYDPTKLYRITVRVRRTSGTGSFYAGVAGRDATDTAWVNVYGSNALGANHYFAAASAQPGSAWTTYIGYFTGTGYGYPDGSPHPDPTNPGAMNGNAKYFRPMIILNYGASGTYEVDYIGIDILPRTDDFTIIDGGVIRTGVIKSPSGNVEIDLTNEYIKALNLWAASNGRGSLLIANPSTYGGGVFGGGVWQVSGFDPANRAYETSYSVAYPTFLPPYIHFYRSLGVFWGAGWAIIYQWLIPSQALKILQRELPQLDTLYVYSMYSDDNTYVALYDLTTSSFVLRVSRPYGSEIYSWSARLALTHDYLLTVTIANTGDDWGAYLFWRLQEGP